MKRVTNKRARRNHLRDSKIVWAESER
ncbi:hypothetical protein AHF37_01146 [Paragonimus kellicotti]|nr:hypothetical protein AHF37_01146 [Paragonimus kellicotti]